MTKFKLRKNKPHIYFKGGFWFVDYFTDLEGSFKVNEAINWVFKKNREIRRHEKT